MQTLENQPFVYADIVYDENTRQFGYIMAALQEDESYDVSPAKFGFRSIEEARDAASLEYFGKSAKQKVVRNAANRKVLAQWITLNSAAYLFSAVLLSILGTILFGDSLSFSMPPIGIWILLIMRLGVGLLVGTAQWLILRRFFPNMRWAGWAIATALGIFLGQFTSAFARAVIYNFSPLSATLDILEWIATGVSAQIAIGAIQWVVLKRYADHAVQWIAATAASGVVIGLISGILYHIIAVRIVNEARAFYFAELTPAIASCLGAIITGIVLTRLLPHTHNPKPQESIRPALKLT